MGERPMISILFQQRLILSIFLLGIIAAASFTAMLFFLRFWKDTRDFLFAAFAFFFLVEGADRVVLTTMKHPNEGSPWVFVARLIALLVLLGAIVRKNYPSRN
jgi:uncharacterized membrane protein HdeD (DUF308 family)